MARLYAILLILIWVGPSRALAQCTDIAKVDFANRALTVTTSQAKQVFHFRHGLSLEFEAGKGKTSDWQTTIRQDIVVKPQGSGDVRFLTLFRNRLTGSGSWTYLVGLQCSGGQIRQVFQSSGELMQVIKVSRKSVLISTPVWKPADPACCPSARKELRYTWDSRTRRYALAQLPTAKRSGAH